MAERARQTPGGIARGWFVLGIIYAVFFFWYTSFEGPLTDEEIAYFTEVIVEAPQMEPGVRSNLIEFMKNDTGDDWAMWNAVDLADTPAPMPGIAPGETSQDLVDRYTEPFFGMALLRAAHPVLVGDAAGPALDIWGIENGEDWDSGLLVRYRSRRDLMEIMEQMVQSGDEIHEFKIAALSKTIAFPLDPWFHAGDPRFLLALIFLVIGLMLQLRHNARS